MVGVRSRSVDRIHDIRYTRKCAVDIVLGPGLYSLFTNDKCTRIGVVEHRNQIRLDFVIGLGYE